MTTTKDISGESDVTKPRSKAGDKRLRNEISKNICRCGGLLEYSVHWAWHYEVLVT
jgi:aerobic-type carbon monoxide dehydrogenase small subunit (CoxS/CutS family)